MWSAAATSLVAFTSVLNADTDSAQMRNLQNRVDALEQGRGGVINPPARPQIKDGANLFVFGDLLYWQAHEEGLPLAVENDSTATDLRDSDVINLHYNWDFGFRVGVGYNMMHDSWDLSLTWLRFYTSAQKHERGVAPHRIWPTLMHPATDVTGQTINNNGCDVVHGKWRMKLNQLDLDLGREFFVSKWLTLRPHFGLRSTWIYQRLFVDYEAFAQQNRRLDVEVLAKDNWWGLGIETGLDTQWGLGGGWSIYGNIATAIEYGFHDMKEESFVEGVPPKFLDVDDSFRISHPILDFQLGLRWDYMFANDCCHLGLQAGWEHHVYFGQNQFPRFVDDIAIGTMVGNQGNLSMQGWTFELRLDF